MVWYCWSWWCFGGDCDGIGVRGGIAVLIVPGNGDNEDDGDGIMVVDVVVVTVVTMVMG